MRFIFKNGKIIMSTYEAAGKVFLVDSSSNIRYEDDFVIELKSLKDYEFKLKKELSHMYAPIIQQKGWYIKIKVEGLFEEQKFIPYDLFDSQAQAQTRNLPLDSEEGGDDEE